MILQKEYVHTDIAIDKLKGLISFFERNRKDGFMSALISARELASEMEIEPKFHEKSIISRKRNKFNENVSEEEILSVEESFRINYYIYI